MLRHRGAFIHRAVRKPLAALGQAAIVWEF
jgi:hypothetical protein